MIDRIISQAPLFLILAARSFTLLLTLPLFSMRNVSRAAKVALAGYMAFLLFPNVDLSVYGSVVSLDGSFSIPYIICLAGEAVIGIIMGFYISIIFAAFSTAGQFFAFQMGFSASEVYDSLSQVENPLMGQFFNMFAMLIFMQSGWMMRLFSEALVNSFSSLNAFTLTIAAARSELLTFLLSGLTKLFADAFVIALPIIGVLALISVSMGILSKAAPQMNLLSEGFPIMICVSFGIIFFLMEPLAKFFVTSFEGGFALIEELFAKFIIQNPKGGIL